MSVFLNPKSRLYNCFLVRKKKFIKKIVLPDQYLYKKLSENPKAVEEDFNKTNFDKATSYIRSIIPIRYHGTFFSLWQFLKEKSLKRKYFDISK